MPLDRKDSCSQRPLRARTILALFPGPARHARRVRRGKQVRYRTFRSRDTTGAGVEGRFGRQSFARNRRTDFGRAFEVGRLHLIPWRNRPNSSGQ